MATLNATKYPNNVRTITGLVNAVLQDDVSLLCDTSGGEVKIQLPELIAGRWSVQWRLYVIDIADNASANKITIEAPASYKVNNQPTLEINTDGEGCVVRILDDTNFITTYNTSANAATGFIALTVLELQALITAGTVQEGVYYRVTDANLSDLGIIVQGTSSTTVSLEGKGLFLNADYQNLGGNNVGVWNATMPPVTAGVSVCIWDGLMYLSADGVVGATPVDAEHWTLISKSVANGYILECDDVRYDPFISAGVDRLLYRADKRQNEVEYFIYQGGNSLVKFQWGNYDENFPTGAIGCYGNKVISGGFIDNVNQSQRAKTIDNIVSNGSVIEANTNGGEIVNNFVNNGASLSCPTQSGFIVRNTIENQSFVILTSQDPTGSFVDNVVQNHGNVNIPTNESLITENFIHTNGTLSVAVNQSRLDRNEIGGQMNVALVSPNLTAYSNKKAVSGESNFDVILDLSDGAIWAANVLTIPLTQQWAGIFNLSNSNKTIDQIINLPTTHDSTFVTATNTEVTTITTVSVIGASANEIIAAQAAGGIQMTGRTNGTDSIVMRKLGNLNGVVGRPNVYQ